MFSFNIQRLVHWLDIGEGKKVLAVLALVAFVLLFSAYHSYKRFAGPQTEYVIQQNLIGKHLRKEMVSPPLWSFRRRWLSWKNCTTSALIGIKPYRISTMRHYIRL